MCVKNVYFDALDDIVNIYITPIDVKPDSYAEYDVDSNEKKS